MTSDFVALRVLGYVLEVSESEYGLIWRLQTQGRPQIATKSYKDPALNVTLLMTFDQNAARRHYTHFKAVNLTGKAAL